jgi:hypothetical protein
MFDTVYKGLTRGQLIRSIHSACDTSAGLYARTDSQIVALYQQHVEGVKNV